jgi:hypothetical protein
MSWGRIRNAKKAKRPVGPLPPSKPLPARHRPSARTVRRDGCRCQFTADRGVRGDEPRIPLCTRSVEIGLSRSKRAAPRLPHFLVGCFASSATDLFTPVPGWMGGEWELRVRLAGFGSGGRMTWGLGDCSLTDGHYVRGRGGNDTSATVLIVVVVSSVVEAGRRS